jgi:hypothetical protein
MGLEVIQADLLMKAQLRIGKVRHNPAAIGAVAYELAKRGREQRAADR